MRLIWAHKYGDSGPHSTVHIETVKRSHSNNVQRMRPDRKVLLYGQETREEEEEWEGEDERK